MKNKTSRAVFSDESLSKNVYYVVKTNNILALLAAGLIALRPNPILGGIGGGIIFVAGIICLYAFIAVTSGFFRWRRYYRDFSTDTLPVVRRVLEEDRVLSRDVTASEVYEIEEFEDEGPGYIFSIGDGKSLLLIKHRITQRIFYPDVCTVSPRPRETRSF